MPYLEVDTDIPEKFAGQNKSRSLFFNDILTIYF